MPKFINNFTEFSSRKGVFYDTILESLIKYKDNFKDILREMGDNPTAKEILSIENKDIANTRNNMFGSTNKNDTIDFIPDRKYQDLLNLSGKVWTTTDSNKFATVNFKKYPFAEAVWKALRLVVPEKLPILIPVGTRGTISETRAQNEKTKKTYVAFTPIDKSISPVPANVKYLREDPNFFNTEISRSTQEIKVGRGMKSLLVGAGINKSDKEIEDFVNKFKSSYDMFNNAFRYMDIVEGEDIKKYYDYKTYEVSGKGTLGSSCMQYDKCQDFFEIYIENPERCKLIILRSKNDKNKIIGRSLLWKLDDGKMFMDRIYTTYDSDVNLYKEFAKKNGWYCKKSQGQGWTGLIDPSGKEIYDTMLMIVSIKKKKYNKYPYMDTFKDYFNSLCILTNDGSYDRKKSCYNLSNTDGGKGLVRACPKCNGKEKILCNKCGGIGNFVCKDCKGAKFTACKECTKLISEVMPILRKGMWVKTNGNGPYETNQIVTGVIAMVSKANNEILIAQNQFGNMTAKAQELGFKRTFKVNLDNRYAWMAISKDPFDEDYNFTKEEIISITPKDKFKIGDYVRTNGDLNNVIDSGNTYPTVSGWICKIMPDKFWIANNETISDENHPIPEAKEYGCKGAWDVTFTNGKAWIQFGTKNLEPKNKCEICKGKIVIPCSTCKGSGTTQCETCKGTGGDPCPECSIFN